jgi:hypothetical protein
MRSALPRATLLLVATALLAACGDTTLPWTDEPSRSSAGGGSYTVSPAALAFQGVPGGVTPAAQRLDVTLQSGSVFLGVEFTGAVANAVLAIDSATAAHVNVSVRPPTTAGTYSGTVTIVGCVDASCTAEVAGSPVVVPVTYTITATTGATALQITPTTLGFQQVAGGADPAPKTLTLSQQGGGTAAWYTCIGTWDTPLTWLTLSPGTGLSLPATIAVSVHGAGLPAGTTRQATLYYQTVPCGQTASNAVSVPLIFTVTAP